MISYVLRRFFWFAVTLWTVFTISFFLMRAVPGGPFDSARKMPPEVLRNIERHYHLDEPLWRQYLRMLGEYLRFDLGHSFKLTDYSVNEFIAEGFPNSAALGVLALAFALTLGLTAGIVSAVRRQTWLDFGLMTVATVGIALPDFVIAGLAILLFCFVFPIFPPAQWGTLAHVVLPACCLGAPYAAYIARLTRTGMLDVLGQDYIRTAYAKGLMGRTVIMKHALKGALLPVVSFLGPAVAGILTGSLVIEKIFAIPGLGMHFIQSAMQRDYTLAMGLVMLDTTIICGMNLFVDLLYKFLDPRVKLE